MRSCASHFLAALVARRRPGSWEFLVLLGERVTDVQDTNDGGGWVDGWETNQARGEKYDFEADWRIPFEPVGPGSNSKY